MGVDEWQQVGVVSGALLAVLTLVTMIWRRVVRPVWTATWRTIRRLDQVADDLLGDAAKGVPSMVDRMGRLEGAQADLARQLAEHIEWHGGGPGRTNGRPPVPTPAPRRRP